MANYTPLIRVPGNKPATKTGWKNTPNIIGVNITRIPGKIISFNEAVVLT